MEMSFEFPVTKSKIFPIDHPEILLVSTLIVASKICFPWTQTSPPLSTEPLPRLDWQQWQQSTPQIAEGGPKPLSRHDLISITSDQVVTMTELELDEYFSRVASLSDNRSMYTRRDRSSAYQLINNKQNRYQSCNPILSNRGSAASGYVCRGGSRQRYRQKRQGRPHIGCMACTRRSQQDHTRKPHRL